MTSQEDMTAAGERAVRAMQAARRSRLTRRVVLRNAAGAGLAATAVTAATAGPAAAAAATAGDASPDTAGRDGGAGDDAAEDGPVIAHVRNARTGEIDVFRGTRQVRVHDTALAAHLIRASR